LFSRAASAIVAAIGHRNWLSREDVMFQRIGALALIACMAGAAQAQTYPDRSARMIVAFSAGGSLDTLARIVSQKLSELWGQSVVVENRPGAAGNAGAIAAAQAVADGYTLHFGAQSLAVNMTIAPIREFDPGKQFEPVVLVATARDVLLVPPDSPARTLAELIAMAKAKPAEFNFGSLGTGSTGHLAGVLLQQLTGIKLQHVPYSQVSAGMTDLMAGRLSLWTATLGGAIGNIKAGKVRALAVSGTTRASDLPDVPTFQEQGVDFVADMGWFGIYAPSGTPPAIVAKINRDVNAILDQPEIKAKATALGFALLGGPPERLGAMLKTETAKWAEIGKTAGFGDK
jgi:tripartite-type tricarboxylate transporter receptor subunit TctC